MLADVLIEEIALYVPVKAYHLYWGGSDRYQGL